MANSETVIGTAFAVWTGIGAAGTFLVGVALLGDTLGTLRVLSIFHIVTGVGLMQVRD